MFDQESPDSLWLGGRLVNSQVIRGVDDAPEVRRLSVLPPGHPQGYQEAFDAVIAGTYAAVLGEQAPGLPVFADGVRATLLTTAVLCSAADGRWVDV